MTVITLIVTPERRLPAQTSANLTAQLLWRQHLTLRFNTTTLCKVSMKINVFALARDMEDLLAATRLQLSTVISTKVQFLVTKQSSFQI